MFDTDALSVISKAFGSIPSTIAVVSAAVS
jgi:hypothetical protein